MPLISSLESLIEALDRATADTGDSEIGKIAAEYGAALAVVLEFLRNAPPNEGEPNLPGLETALAQVLASATRAGFIPVDWARVLRQTHAAFDQLSGDVAWRPKLPPPPK